LVADQFHPKAPQELPGNSKLMDFNTTRLISSTGSWRNFSDCPRSLITFQILLELSLGFFFFSVLTTSSIFFLNLNIVVVGPVETVEKVLKH
jgi:hypothetical protein